MRKVIVFVICYTLFTSSIFAEVKITPENHIPNVNWGACAFCSLETLGRTHGWKQMHGFVAENDRPAFHHILVDKLKKKNIKFNHHQIDETEWWYIAWYHPKGGNSEVLGCFRDEKQAKQLIIDGKKAGTYWVDKEFYRKTQVLADAVNKDLGAAVSITLSDTDSHMLVITGMDEKEVRLIDSNYDRGKIRYMDLRKFLKMWNGFAIIIEKKEN